MGVYKLKLTIILQCVVLLCRNVDTLLVKINGEIDTSYNESAKRNVMHANEFNFSADQTNFIPFDVSNQTFESIVNSNCIETPKYKHGKASSFTVWIETPSPQPIGYSNVVRIDQKVSAIIYPSFPTYFTMDIPVTIELVDVHLSSPSELCSLVKITSFSQQQPNYTLHSIGSFELTMTKTADLRVKRSYFERGVMMVLLIPLPAAQCEASINESMKVLSDNYAKNISLVINAGRDEFWKPNITLIAIFLCPYIAFVLMIGCELICAKLFPQFTSLIFVLSQVRRDRQQDCEREPSDLLVSNSVVPHEELESNSQIKDANIFNLVNKQEVTVADWTVKPIREIEANANIYKYICLLVGFLHSPSITVILFPT